MASRDAASQRSSLAEPRIWIALLTSILAGGFLMRDLVRHRNPGPISATHARDPSLTGAGSCRHCHGGLFRSMAEACAVCHAEIEGDIELGRGLHGTLGEIDPLRCADCHGEHHGSSFRPTNAASFAAAGVPDPDAYDHAALDFRLEGRHAALACEACHASADVELLGPDEARFRGLEQGCDSCHADVHEGRMGNACADCHGQAEPFAEVRRFRHTLGFDDRGAHEGLACGSCHSDASPYALEIVMRGPPLAETRSCRDCHESPHRASFLAEVERGAPRQNPTSCARCHSALHGDFAAHGEAMPRALHAASGFPLSAPHASVACAACHAVRADESLQEGFQERFPGRSPEACEACHADPHQDQFETAVRGACLDCHERHAFQPPSFEVDAHADTGFPLEGAHTAVACHACHRVPEGEARRVFAGTATTCQACHDDAHEASLFGGRPEGLACASCHTSETFSDVDRARFEHDLATAFPLAGVHADVSCEACHAPLARPDAHGRTRRPALGTSCQDCHGDPHVAQFRVAGETDCARCHDARGSVEAFDHDRATRFALDECHARLACSKCHLPWPLPNGGAAVRYKPLGLACVDCHEAALESVPRRARTDGGAGR